MKKPIHKFRNPTKVNIDHISQLVSNQHVCNTIKKTHLKKKSYFIMVKNPAKFYSNFQL